MTTTTDTPRTDDQFPWKAECPRMSNYCDKHLRGYWRNVGSPWHGVIKEAFEIEKELNASKAEVERLRNELSDWDYGTRAKREQTRAERAEAEVERLRDLLHDCLSFLALHGAVGATPDTARLLQKRILATLNQTN